MKALGRIAALFGLLMPIVFPLAAQAACGEGKVPSYSDISSVTYGRSTCFGKCAAYQVDFGSMYSGANCLYIGIANVPKHGRYIADCSRAALPRAIAALKNSRFFDLNWDSSIIPTDVSMATIIVTRCGVTTSLDWPEHGTRKDIPVLIAALDHITNGFRWEKAGNDTTDLLWKPGLP